MSITEPEPIRLEMELENNAATWLRQTVTTTSIAIAILAYFEVRGGLRRSPLAIMSIFLLLFTSLMMGVMTSVNYRRRKNILIKQGILKDLPLNHWYLMSGILTVVGLLGVGVAVVRNRRGG